MSRDSSQGSEKLRTFYRWGWLPLVAGCVVIAGGVIGAYELVLSHLGRVEEDPVLRVAFITRALVTSSLLALWAGWYVLFSRRKLEQARDELRRRTAELEHKARRAEEEAGLGAMCRLLAHEIRAPLHGVALRGAMLEKISSALPEGQSARVKELARLIEDETTRLDQLLGEYMAYGRSASTSLEPSPLDLAAVCREVLASHRAASAAKELEVSVDLPGEMILRADPIRVRQALGLLLRSAIDSAKVGGKVKLTGRNNGADVTLEVADDGPGLEDPSAVFRPFYVSRGGASGLGFAIVRDVMRAHGGEVSASNPNDGGARILVRLPVERA
ncbi:MAG: HAMP domain-containing histidine kinase [Myxococcales bacterium]|nr:HAMP domain-containing histidine kinase [Myxococcales bacterium]